MAKTVRPGLRLVDRLILLVAWIATCGVVYLMGFYLGKGTQERHLRLEERVVRLPVTSAPPAEGERRKTGGDLTFYEQLLSGGRAGGDGGAPSAGPPTGVAAASKPAPQATPPGPVPAPAPQAPPRTPRVASAPVPATSPPAPGGAGGAGANLGVPLPHKAPPPSPPPAVAAAPAPGAPAKPALPPTIVPGSAVVERQVVAPTWPPPARPVPVAPAVATTAPTSLGPPPPAPRTSGGWTVEANPTRDRDEAEGLQKRLRARGYDSTLVRVLRDGETWYRLHVGRYGSAEQASEVMRKLRDSEGVAHVFVATE